MKFQTPPDWENDVSGVRMDILIDIQVIEIGITMMTGAETTTATTTGTTRGTVITIEIVTEIGKNP